MKMKRLIALAVAAFASAGIYAATLTPIQLLNPAGSTSGQAIISTGASSAPAWGGVGVSGLAAIAANSVIGNATNASAIPTAVTVTGCNGAGQALQWTNGTGFGCNSNIATSGANTNITSLSSPTITTPNITGVTSGAGAAAGQIGECKSSNVPLGSAVSLTTSTTANVTSVSLTAGNWLCYGNVGFGPGGATVTSAEGGWISTTSAAVPTLPNNGGEVLMTSLPSTAGGNANTLPVGVTMMNVATTTTTYLEAYAAFATSTQSAYGYINCIRWH
jgi:hypothetical protein